MNTNVLDKRMAAANDAGYRDATWIWETIHEYFDRWLEEENLKELPEQGRELLEEAFAKGVMGEHLGWVSIRWHIDDVKSIANDLSDDECYKVLELAKKNHDAEVGINWEVLEFWAEEVRSKRA